MHKAHKHSNFNCPKTQKWPGTLGLFLGRFWAVFSGTLLGHFWDTYSLSDYFYNIKKVSQNCPTCPKQFKCPKPLSQGGFYNPWTGTAGQFRDESRKGIA